MSRQKPGSYTVSVGDVAQVVLEHAQEWGATAYFVVTLGKPNGPGAYVDVTLREGLYEPAGREVARLRYPLDERDVGRWPANILHAVMHVYDKVRTDPWTWPEGKRRRVVEME